MREIGLAAVENRGAHPRVQQCGRKQCCHGTDAAAKQPQWKTGEVALPVDPVDGVDQSLRQAGHIEWVLLRLFGRTQVKQKRRYAVSGQGFNDSAVARASPAGVRER